MTGDESSTDPQRAEEIVGTTKSVITPELCRTFALLAGAGGSVTATAGLLGVDKATVSKQIRPLVRGCPPVVPRPWLIKQGRRFVLTDEGRRILPTAREQVGGWADFVAAVAANRAAEVTVACGHEAAGGVVLAAATRFYRSHPDVVLKVAVVRGRQRIEGLASGLYDLALVTDTSAAVREVARLPVTVEALAEDELVLACGSRAPWATDFADPSRPADIDEVAGWPLILPGADAPIRRRWDELVRRSVASASPRVALEVGGWRALCGYVQAGFGVGLVPRSVAAAAGAKVRVRPIVTALRPANRLSVARRLDTPDVSLSNDFRTALTDVSVASV